jgi:hypothetical protein
MAPVSYAYQRVCGHRYHLAINIDDGDMQYCACDTGAIGRCANDYRPVCGDHSRLRGGRRLCLECAAEFDAEGATAAARAQHQAALEKLQPWLDQFRIACAGLQELTDPTDRFVILLLLARRTSQLAFRYHREATLALATDELRPIFNTAANELLGDRISPFWDATSKYPGSWTIKPQALISHWEQTGRLTSFTKVTLRIISWEKGMLGGMKSVTRDRIDAWPIQVGSRGTSGTYGSPGASDVYVLTDGTVGTSAYQSRKLNSAVERPDIDDSHIMKLRSKGHLRFPAIPSSTDNAIQVLTGAKPGLPREWQ